MVSAKNFRFIHVLVKSFLIIRMMFFISANFFRNFLGFIFGNSYRVIVTNFFVVFHALLMIFIMANFWLMVVL